MSHDHKSHEEEQVHTTDEESKGGNFWGLRPRNLSDEEFVERIRNGRVTWNRWKWGFVLLFVGIILLILRTTPQLIEMMADLMQLGPSPDIARLTVVIGLAYGFFFGGNFYQAFQILIDLLKKDRTTELLLKYHDLVQQHRHQQHTNHTT